MQLTRARVHKEMAKPRIAKSARKKYAKLTLRATRTGRGWSGSRRVQARCLGQAEDL